MKRLLVLMSLAALTGCAQFDTLSDSTLPRTGPTPLLASDAPKPLPDAFDTPGMIKAKGIIPKGETTGIHNGEVYSCGNADCSIAVRGPLATPEAQSNGAKK